MHIFTVLMVKVSCFKFHTKQKKPEVILKKAFFFEKLYFKVIENFVFYMFVLFRTGFIIHVYCIFRLRKWPLLTQHFII